MRSCGGGGGGGGCSLLLLWWREGRTIGGAFNDEKRYRDN
jgi:hypothetical protein